MSELKSFEQTHWLREYVAFQFLFGFHTKRNCIAWVLLSHEAKEAFRRLADERILGFKAAIEMVGEANHCSASPTNSASKLPPSLKPNGNARRHERNGNSERGEGVTDREKEIAIAKRLGWTIKPHQQDGHSYRLLVQPDGKATGALMVGDSEFAFRQESPAYFTDRNAAQEIVEWFAARRAPHDEWILAHQFSDAISPSSWSEQNFWDAMRATPRQIAEAACKVWGVG